MNVRKMVLLIIAASFLFIVIIPVQSNSHQVNPYYDPIAGA
ncbi:hypothetical protein QYF52_03745 [Paenibacillus polymyxa]|nr:hypothetical protein [Paenibacillus polymyxa]MDN4077035.1 hypothetical protein [Paenibacillus polymyxa]MDN4102461.1 hypothetical protein [Paenibacillus polymyxa]MDN4112678.1 hypothetical protein [Paenibacillus polymyxa]